MGVLVKLLVYLSMPVLGLPLPGLYWTRSVNSYQTVSWLCDEGILVVVLFDDDCGGGGMMRYPDINGSAVMISMWLCSTPMARSRGTKVGIAVQRVKTSSLLRRILMMAIRPCPCLILTLFGSMAQVLRGSEDVETIDVF
jgi:hypothetical protein